MTRFYDNVGCLFASRVTVFNLINFTRFTADWRRCFTRDTVELSPLATSYSLSLSFSNRYSRSSRCMGCMRISKYRHYSCMRSKCTKFSHGGSRGRGRRASQRCVLCLFLAAACHMLLVSSFLKVSAKSNGDTEVSPVRQRFVNNSLARSPSKFRLKFTGDFRGAHSIGRSIASPIVVNGFPSLD